VAVNRATREWAVAQRERQVAAATAAYRALYRPGRVGPGTD
jgi:hypothetical protein